MIGFFVLLFEMNNLKNDKDIVKGQCTYIVSYACMLIKNRAGKGIFTSPSDELCSADGLVQVSCLC